MGGVYLGLGWLSSPRGLPETNKNSWLKILKWAPSCWVCVSLLTNGRIISI